MQSDTSPATDCFPITPSDSADLSGPVRALLIANGGTLKITKLNGDPVTLTVPAGLLPVAARRVWATGTTATGITGLA